MLNEEKVILMTQMASYEENEGKKNMAIGRYFRSDYIAIQVLKSILCATIAYGVCFALFVFPAMVMGTMLPLTRYRFPPSSSDSGLRF